MLLCCHTGADDYQKTPWFPFRGIILFVLLGKFTKTGKLAWVQGIVFFLITFSNAEPVHK
jgi:hypothetical protein